MTKRISKRNSMSFFSSLNEKIIGAQIAIFISTLIAACQGMLPNPVTVSPFIFIAQYTMIYMIHLSFGIERKINLQGVLKMFLLVGMSMRASAMWIKAVSFAMQYFPSMSEIGRTVVMCISCAFITIALGETFMLVLIAMSKRILPTKVLGLSFEAILIT